MFYKVVAGPMVRICQVDIWHSEYRIRRHSSRGGGGQGTGIDTTTRGVAGMSTRHKHCGIWGLVVCLAIGWGGTGCSGSSQDNQSSEPSEGCRSASDCPDGESCVRRDRSEDPPGECASLLRCDCPANDEAYCRNDVEQPCVVPTNSCQLNRCPDGYTCNAVANTGNCICLAEGNEDCALRCESDADCGVDNGFSCEDGRCVK
jgi:hypothetical protein